MTLKDFKQELVNYARTLLPPEYKGVIRVPGKAATNDFVLRSAQEKPTIEFCKKHFGTETKSFKLGRKETIQGEKIIESFNVDLTRENEEVSDIFSEISESEFLETEKESIKHNMTFALNNPKSEVHAFITLAKEAGLIQTDMSDSTKLWDDKSSQMKTWEAFLKAWPSSRVKSMTLTEYTNLNKDDSFCYWIESKTQNLGSIWGGSSYKFGIYKKNANKVDPRPGYKTDGEYAWVAKYGANKKEAFENVKKEIIKIVNAAESDELEVVNHVNLGEAYKWKIAALYHKEIPLIYKPDALVYLVKHFNKSATIASERYQILTSQKAADEDIIGLSWRLWDIYAPKNPEDHENEKEFWKNRPLNQIFYGPPGTGKTYSTINEAVKIVEQLSDEDFDQKYTDRKHVKSVFEEYVSRGQIAFTTFHQSMSYEDFIEGIKPKTHEIGEGASRNITVSYETEPGIFRKLCENAEGFLSTKKSIQETKQPTVTAEELSKAIFFKMSLGRAGIEEDQEIYNYCIRNNVVALGWGDEINFEEAQDETAIKKLIEENDGSKSAIPFVKHFKLYMKPGNFVVISKGNSRIRALGKVTGDYNFNDQAPIGYSHFRSVEWILKDVDIPSSELYEINLDQKTLYKLDNELIKLSFFEKLKAEKTVTSDFVRKNFVLIIDEINRGNVSQIFGELITLLEEDKRKGNKEELFLTLTYSNKLFSVPNNLYLIGTMNTADRSVESLDTALRRRFMFQEMPSNPDLLSPAKAIVDLWFKYEDNYSDEYYEKLEILNEFIGLIIKQKQEDKIWEKVDASDTVEQTEELFLNEGLGFEGINLKRMLKAINFRIEKLLDADHSIGHAYFMDVYSALDPIESLRTTFQKNILPLLQEYFYGDYGKIGLVLGEAFVKIIESEQSFAKFKPIDPAILEDYKARQIYKLVDVEELEEKDFIAIYE